MSEVAKNKLVRDNMIELFNKDGYDTKFRYIEDDSELMSALIDKLFEEAREVKEAKTIEELREELADCLEVIYSIAKFQEIDIEELNAVKEEKAKVKGSFDDGLYLESYTKRD